MFAIVGLLIILFCSFQAVLSGYKPDWASIDSRPLPVWYDEAKFGIFSHWGVYSVPAFGSEWFWWYWKGQHDPKYEQFVEKHYPNGTTYADFAKFFTAADFDANNYAEIVKASGARYFVLTSKHHEGFTLWPSTTSWNWNAVDVGPHRDLVKAFSEATRAQNVHFGLYFSLFDWFHPLYLNDIKTHRTDFVQSVSFPQLLEIVNEYHPEVIWSDGDWEQPDTYWRSKEFLAWLYNESPVKEKVVVNDRWGRGISGKHGGFLTYQDHYDPGRLLSRKWENCLTLDKRSWGYRRYLKPSDVLSLAELISQLARTISCGGNMLLNVGPDHTGRIVPIFEQRLREFGQWVTINTEAIYGSKAWVHQSDGPTIWYTSQMRNSTELSPHRMYNPQQTFNTIVYAFVLSIPRTGRIKFPSVHLTDKTVVSIVGTSTKVPYKKGETSLSVDISGIPWQDLPSTVSIVLKIEFAASSQINPLRTATESDSSGDDDDDASSTEEGNNAVGGKGNSALSGTGNERTRGQDEGRRYGQMMELVSATDDPSLVRRARLIRRQTTNVYCETLKRLKEEDAALISQILLITLKPRSEATEFECSCSGLSIAPAIPSVELACPSLDANFQQFPPTLFYPDFMKGTLQRREEREAFQVILTNENGERKFAFCFKFLRPHFIPNKNGALLSVDSGIGTLPPLASFSVLVFVSPYPQEVLFHGLASDFVDLFHKEKSQIMQMCCDFLKLRFTTSGESSIKPSKYVIGGTIYANHWSRNNVSTVVEKVGVENAALIFLSLLSERRVIITGSNVADVSTTVQTFVRLLAPLEWPHTLIPIVPDSQTELCFNPTPYICGILRYNLSRINELLCPERYPRGEMLNDGITVMDVDRGMIVPPILRSDCRVGLKAILQHTSSMGFPQSAVCEIVSAFKSCLPVRNPAHSDYKFEKKVMIWYAKLFGHYRKFGQNILSARNRKLFAHAHPCAETRLFLKWFMENGILQSFIFAQFRGEAIGTSNSLSNSCGLPLRFQKILKKYAPPVDGNGNRRRTKAIIWKVFIR